MTEGRFGDTVYEVAGDGPPVVLVHGLGMTRAMWDWQWPALTGRFQVLRYDLLGHGESAKPRDAYSLTRFADQILDLIDHLRWDRPALVGFSLGGMIVRAFALAHPERTAALAILNSAHDRTEVEREAILNRVAQAAQDGPKATAGAALARWFNEDYAAQHPEVLEQVRRWILANDPAVYPLIYRVLAESDAELAEGIAGLRCPTLVITGGEDHGNSPDMALRMSALIPGAEVEILPGLKHMGLVEDAETFNARLVSFLETSLGAEK